jgi:GTP-binding protein
VSEAYETVRAELEAYGADLQDKAEILVLSKSDTLDEELTDALCAELAEASGARVLTVSGATGAGVEGVLDAVIAAIGGRSAEPEQAETDWSPL